MTNPLRTYGLTIAYLGLFTYSIGTISLIALLFLNSSSEVNYFDGVTHYRIEYYWASLPLLLLGLLVSVLMLYGIHKQRAGFLLAWLFVSGLFFICQTLFMLWLLALWSKGKPYFGSIIGHLLLHALAGTVWFGIFLLYRQIDEENRDDDDSSND